MTRLLLIIDIQNDYFPGGAYPLVGSTEAAVAGARLLAAARDNGEQIIHVQHISEGDGATFFLPGTAGAEIHPLLAPQGDEPVVRKASPNSFLGTDLGERLAAAAPDELLVIGMMSSMCVDATVRAASDAGYSVTVAEDACAAPDLTFGDEVIGGRQVHAAFMAALGGAYAKVTTVDALLA